MDSSSQSEADAARAELQHFVYAASHDLQEPLRAIVSYSQLLERHLAGDETARDYIAYIVGGANRMSALLRDLLTLSRAGSTQRRAMVNLNVAAQAALLKLAPAIAELSAEIKRERAAGSFRRRAEMTQLFEHLIGNALKFRRRGQAGDCDPFGAGKRRVRDFDCRQRPWHRAGFSAGSFFRFQAAAGQRRAGERPGPRNLEQNCARTRRADLDRERRA